MALLLANLRGERFPVHVNVGIRRFPVYVCFETAIDLPNHLDVQKGDGELNVLMELIKFLQDSFHRAFFDEREIIMWNGN